MVTVNIQPDNPFEGWTTMEEAAELIGRTKTTIRGWADQGRIQSYYIGRKVRVVNLEEVRNCAKERKPKKPRQVS